MISNGVAFSRGVHCVVSYAVYGASCVQANWNVEPRLVGSRPSAQASSIGCTPVAALLDFKAGTGDLAGLIMPGAASRCSVQSSGVVAFLAAVTSSRCNILFARVLSFIHSP